MNIPTISAEEVRSNLTIEEVLACNEQVYLQKSQENTVVWPTVFYEFDPGHADMDIKSGYLPKQKIFGHKTVAFMEANTQKGLPDLVGLIVVFSSETGLPLGLVDGSSVTGMRTGAAGALGAKYLAKPDSKNALIVGTGNQARFQISALLTVFPQLEKIRIANPRHPEHAASFTATIREVLLQEFGMDASAVSFEAVSDFPSAVSDSDIVITITPSHTPLIQKEWVKPGTHFSCIGADMAGKEELDPAIFADAVVFADDLVHCKQVGELELPLKQGVLTEEQIRGELGDLMLKKVAGRQSEEEITVFDSTGMALLDLAAAHILLKKLKG